ncbi:hypothetical protein [Anditalea andensis]|uniref:Uncharacterized protein n=1 Tax=Anditalea andensis TaxID=1048983 RepID=A0A074KZA7_9BACT|nr:hypothetical protein [Anditalea andensis]KEO73540.1 hypothetical protein EL17_11605 [Anditalea andensis]
MKKAFYLLLLCFINYSCQNPPTSTADSDEGIQRETVSNTHEEANITAIKPRLVQMNSAARSSLDKKQILKPAFKGKEITSLILWADGDQWPVMLEVTYTNQTANPKSIYYFEDRKLLAIEEPTANFIFKKNKLQVWADENWHPLKNKTTDQWLDKENIFLDNAKKYLNAFDISFEE